MTKFDWDTRVLSNCLSGELETIRSIFHGGPGEPVEHKDIAEDMLLTKIGSAGVSAVPMAARVSQKVGADEDRSNFLLMHAMGPNVAGVIGSAVAAGVFISLFGDITVSSDQTASAIELISNITALP